MELARYFVFNRRDQWFVTLDGRELARHPSREAAMQSAVIMADLMGAMSHDADVMVEADGELSVAWTFGVDPLPGHLNAEAA